MPDASVILAERLRKLRDSREVTLTDVEKETGIRQQYISNYELGKRKPDPDKLCRLADYYGVTTDYLFGRYEDASACQTTPDRQVLWQIYDIVRRRLRKGDEA